VLSLSASRWCCTSSGTCPATLYLDDLLCVVKDPIHSHNHKIPEIIRLADGTYKKIKRKKVTHILGSS
jgi:hypothetical protein